MFLWEHVWCGAVIGQNIIALIYSIHRCARYVYVPNLTNDANQFIKFVFLVIMVALQKLFGVGRVDESDRVSQSVVIVICSLFLATLGLDSFPTDPPYYECLPDN